MNDEEAWHRSSRSAAQASPGLLAASCCASPTGADHPPPDKEIISTAADGSAASFVSAAAPSSAATATPAAATPVVPMLRSGAAGDPTAALCFPPAASSAVPVSPAAAAPGSPRSAPGAVPYAGASAHSCRALASAAGGAALFTAAAAPFSATSAGGSPDISPGPACSSPPAPDAATNTAAAARAASEAASSFSVPSDFRVHCPSSCAPGAGRFPAARAGPSAVAAAPGAPFRPPLPAAGAVPVASAARGAAVLPTGEDAAASVTSGRERTGGQQQHVVRPCAAAAPAASLSSAARGTGSRSYRIGVQSNATPYYALRCLLQQPQPFAPPDFVPGEEALRRLQDTRVLVVGAGGLGCELLKCLCLSGFKRITVLDMDVVQMSNLHRQFLFREHHVGQFKASVAAEFLNSKFAHLGVAVESCVCRLEEKDETFYRQFQMVLSGLDSIEARRWLNSMIHSLVERDENGEVDVTTSIPLLDGGTEGLKGQARFIFPFVTSCFECSLDSFPPQKTYPLCTIAETPRLPEHCIEYAMLVQWPKEHPGEAFDSDTSQHVEWLFSAAQRRAEAFGIHGVTYSLTLGVAKRIIPAVVSTNAIIAAILVEEAVKIATGCLCSTHDFVVAAAGWKEKDATAVAAGGAAPAEGAMDEEAAEATTAVGISLAAETTAAVDYPSAGVASGGSRVAAGAAAGATAPAPASLLPSALSAASGACCASFTTAAPAAEAVRRSTAAAAAAEEKAARTEAAPAAVAAAEEEEENKPASSLTLEVRDAAEAPAAEDEVLSNIQNYIMYMGEAGIYTHTFEYGKKPGCVVCSGRVFTKRIAQPEEETLQDLLDFFAAEPSLRLHKPSITGPRGIVFLQHPPQLRRAYEPNLSKTIR